MGYKQVIKTTLYWYDLLALATMLATAWLYLLVLLAIVGSLREVLIWGLVGSVVGTGCSVSMTKLILKRGI